MEVPVGYGWDDLAVNDQDLMRFLNDHWGVTAGVLRDHGGFTLERISEVKNAVGFGDNLLFGDILMDFVSDTGIYGPYGVLAKVMEAETGIRIWYLEADVEERRIKTIMFPYLQAPWELSPLEQKLDEEALEGIFNRYMDELGAKGAVPGTIYMAV